MAIAYGINNEVLTTQWTSGTTYPQGGYEFQALDPYPSQPVNIPSVWVDPLSFHIQTYPQTWSEIQNIKFNLDLGYSDPHCLNCKNHPGKHRKPI